MKDSNAFTLSWFLEKLFHKTKEKKEK